MSAVIQRDVLSCIMSPALNASLSPKARDEWMSSLVQAEYRDALLAAVYVSVNGDADQDISPRTPYLTGYCCNFLEHVFRFPKNSLNPFPDF